MGIRPVEPLNQHIHHVVEHLPPAGGTPGASPSRPPEHRSSDLLELATSVFTTSGASPLRPPEHRSNDRLELATSVFTTYELQWLQDPEQRNNTVVVGPIHIDAPAERVWELVKQVHRYGEFSGGALTAAMPNGAPVAPGSTIELGVHPELSGLKKLLFAAQLGRSVETITNVDNTLRALCWRRELPLSCGKESERWQVVVPRSEDECLYYTGLWTPGWTGAIAHRALGNDIRDCFAAAAAGIKGAAESTEGEPAPTQPSTRNPDGGAP